MRLWLLFDRSGMGTRSVSPRETAVSRVASSPPSTRLVQTTSQSCIVPAFRKFLRISDTLRHQHVTAIGYILPADWTAQTRLAGNAALCRPALNYPLPTKSHPRTQPDVQAQPRRRRRLLNGAKSHASTAFKLDPGNVREEMIESLA